MAGGSRRLVAHRGTPVPDQPDWALVAHILIAASIYE
jgi:hypothetical protein